MANYFVQVKGTKLSYVNEDNEQDSYVFDFTYAHFLKINGRLYVRNNEDYIPLHCADDPHPVGDLSRTVAAGGKVFQTSSAGAFPIDKTRYVFAEGNKFLCLDKGIYYLQGDSYCRCETDYALKDNLNWWVAVADNRFYLFKLLDGKKHFVRGFTECLAEGLYLDGNEAWQLVDGVGLTIVCKNDACYKVVYDKVRDRLIFYCRYDNEDFSLLYAKKNGKYVPLD